MDSRAEWSLSSLSNLTPRTPMSGRISTQSPESLAYERDLWNIDHPLIPPNDFNAHNFEPSFQDSEGNWRSMSIADDTYAGISPYSAPSGGSSGSSSSRSGSRGSVNMGGGGGGGSSAGYNVSQSYGGRPSAPSGQIDYWKQYRNMKRPEYGDVPELAAFTMPERDDKRIDFLTQQAGAGDRGRLRQTMLRRIMMEAGKLPAGQRNEFIRNALEGYGGAISDIQTASTGTGLKRYQAEYDPLVQEAQTNYQGKRDTRNLEMQKLRDVYHAGNTFDLDRRRGYEQFIDKYA